jgi:hypothetical protein
MKTEKTMQSADHTPRRADGIRVNLRVGRKLVSCSNGQEGRIPSYPAYLFNSDL